MTATATMLRLGCDLLLDDLRRDGGSGLAGRRYGLLGHGASATSDRRPLHLALAASRAGPPTALFGPEHGYYGVEQDMVASADQRDPWTGAPIVSLYGDSEESLRPQPQAFAGLDLLLVDLQDVGSRYYTYAATAVWAAQAALEAGVEVWILDRPNPLGGEVIEGNRRQAGYESFVGAFDTPVRHGLTVGELVRLEARRRAWPDGWRVVAMEGWKRTMLWPDTGLAWIAPSPNMPSITTAFIYPGGCLVEATTLSEGRGTTRPFQLAGAPGLDPPRLAAALDGLGMPGVSFLPVYFKPQFQKHAGEVCGGIEILVTDPRKLAPYRCGIRLLAAVRRLFGEVCGWRAEAYEFVSDRPAIDLLTGGPDLRRLIEQGGDPDDWIATWRDDEVAFREERRPALLYDG